MFWILILMIIVVLLVPNKSGNAEKRKENLALEVLKSIRPADMSRAKKYLEVKSGLKNATPVEMINKLALKKNIKSADEFKRRYKMGAFNFMTSTEQFNTLKKLTKMAREENAKFLKNF